MNNGTMKGAGDNTTTFIVPPYNDNTHFPIDGDVVPGKEFAVKVTRVVE